MAGGASRANQRQGAHHKVRYQGYLLSHQREQNKAKKIIKHLKVHPKSLDAHKALGRLKSVIPNIINKMLAATKIILVA